MAQKYLDSTGLTYLWGKLKDYFQPKLPIGSVYESVNNVNPSTYFGGTWQPLNDGGSILVTSGGDSLVTDSASGVTLTYKWVRTA